MEDGSIVVEHSGYSPTYVIALDNYERSNLLWLLALIGYSNGDFSVLQPWAIPPGGVEPFTFVNNGDWVGQLANKLKSQRTHTNFYVNPPNGTLEVLQTAINRWVETKIQSMTAHEIAAIMEKKNGKERQ